MTQAASCRSRSSAPPRWVHRVGAIVLFISISAGSGCSTSHGVRYDISPGPNGGSEALDLEALERIGIELAKEFSLRKSPPLSQDLMDEDSRVLGIRAVFEYTLEDGGRVIIVHSEVGISRNEASIGFLELRRSKETKLGRAIRTKLEELLRREFPDREIKPIVGSMDTTFAP